MLAGAADDWLQQLRLDLPQKEDVIMVLLKMMRQPTAHSVRKPGGIPGKEARDLDPSVLEPPMNTQGVELEMIRR